MAAFSCSKSTNFKGLTVEITDQKHYIWSETHLTLDTLEKDFLKHNVHCEHAKGSVFPVQ